MVIELLTMDMWLSTRSGENHEWNANQDRFDNMSKNEGDEYGIG
jgi:hypothetical protein